jgi:hypothetical protein
MKGEGRVDKWKRKEKCINERGKKNGVNGKREKEWINGRGMKNG